MPLIGRNTVTGNFIKCSDLTPDGSTTTFTLTNSKTGDNVYVSYTEKTWAEQEEASGAVKVNPFGFVDNVGVIKLSPTSDEWKDSQNLASKAIDGSNKLAAEQAYLYNNWQWNWSGRYDGETTQTYGNPTNKLGRQGLYRKNLSKQGGSFVQRVVKDETIRARVNGKMIDVALIPWIRSRKIYFHAKGLKPNSKFTPFFDGKNVSAWCREEPAFVNFSDRTDDVGNQYITDRYSAHPDGSSDLIADENGEIKNKILGATSLEYNSDAGPLKYLVGTEQGYIVQATKKKVIEVTQRYGIENGKHHGPVYST